jgi:uncharacterized membrane protein YhfC
MKTKHYLLILILIGALVSLAALALDTPEAIPPALNAILMILLPLLLGVYLVNNFKLSWGLFGIGALTFIGSQVLHIPFNSYLLEPFFKRLGLDPTPATTDLIFYALFVGLSAGVFEETARYIVFRFWLKGRQTWKESLMFGAGHGGIEAIIFGALAFFSFIQLFLLKDASPESIAALAGPDRVAEIQGILESYWNMEWYMSLLGAFERLSAICIHLGATILVLQAFRRRNILWYLLAVLYHTAVDALAVYGITTWGVLPTEAVVFGLGALGIAIVFIFREKDEPQIIEPVSPPPQPLKPLSKVEEDITSQELDESRYD